MSYTMLPSPLSSTERLLTSQDPRAVDLARSLGGRFARAYNGYYLPSRRARVWQKLYDAGAETKPDSYGWAYRLPDGKWLRLANVMWHIGHYRRRVVA